MFKEKRLIYLLEAADSGVDRPKSSTSIAQAADQKQAGERLISAQEFLLGLDQFKAEAKKNLLGRIKMEGAGKVMWDHESIKGLNHTEIALTFIEAGEGKHVARNLVKLKNADHLLVASELYKYGQGHFVKRYRDQFELSDQVIIDLQRKAAAREKAQLQSSVDRKDADYARTYVHWQDRRKSKKQS